MAEAALPFLSFKYSGSTRITPSISRKQRRTDESAHFFPAEPVEHYGRRFTKDLCVEKPGQMPLDALTNGHADLLSKCNEDCVCQTDKIAHAVHLECLSSWRCRHGCWGEKMHIDSLGASNVNYQSWNLLPYFFSTFERLNLHIYVIYKLYASHILFSPLIRHLNPSCHWRLWSVVTQRWLHGPSVKGSTSLPPVRLYGPGLQLRGCNHVSLTVTMQQLYGGNQ